MNNQNDVRGFAMQNVNGCGCNQGRMSQHFPQYGQNVQMRSAYGGPPQKKQCDCVEERKAGSRKTDTKSLLDMIDKASFAMDDTRLFLDTHPDCEEAMIFFKKMKKIRHDAIKEYQECVGAMLAYDVTDACDTWCWNVGPLPWDNQCCNGRRV